MVRLSVLDQSPAVTGRTHGESIRHTLSLARHCETLGYDRFWVSEHHNHPAIVGTAPEILLAAMAATTSRIRLGSAGIMLPHYSTLKVAEQFRVLDAIAPGRIDMGLGRAPGSDGRTAFALNPMANERPEQFPSDVRDLMAWVSGQPLVEGHPFGSIKAYPQGETVPETWILGSSDFGAQVAAHFGLPYAFAWFFSDGAGGQRAIELYQKLYQPSQRHPTPNAALCVWALAADTMEEAQHHFTSRAVFRVQRDRGVIAPFMSPEEAAGYTLQPHEMQRIERMRRTAFIGTGPAVLASIEALATSLGVQEMVIVTWTHDETVRRKSYELIARAAGLGVVAAA